MPEKILSLLYVAFIQKVNCSPFHHQHYYLCTFFHLFTHPYDQVSKLKTFKA